MQTMFILETEAGATIGAQTFKVRKPTIPISIDSRRS